MDYIYICMYIIELYNENIKTKTILFILFLCPFHQPPGRNISDFILIKGKFRLFNTLVR